MKNLKALVVGGGIGGLTAAIAMRAKGYSVDLIERDPTWSVYGVGIIQQGNVVRAMAQLGLIDSYLRAGFGYDHVEVFIPTGERVAKIPTPRLVEGYPGNVGIGRPALHKVLCDHVIDAGVNVSLGVTLTALHQATEGVDVEFSDGRSSHYDFVVGADGLYSQIRSLILPAAPKPEFTGQSVWRYNFPRAPEVTGLCAYEGRMGLGVVPLSDELMYLFATTPEPDNPRYAPNELAAQMRAKLSGIPAPAISALVQQITKDDEVVYRPLEWIFLTGPWHVGGVVLLGDAVHSTTPHLGQGAGMAIEDSIVLADELDKADSLAAAFTAYRNRRFERCQYIVEASLAICRGQLGLGPPVENVKATREMFEKVSAPI